MKELMEPEQMLEILANARELVRQSLRPEEQAAFAAAPATPEGALQVASVADFEYEAVLDAAQSLERELRQAIESREQRLYEDCLDAFYAAEELSRQPEHADLIPKVEEMRRLHEQDYGKPIPPRH